MDALTTKLTNLAHGGGCGCKLAPSVLQQLLAGQATLAGPYARLIIGLETGDDAAVWELDNNNCIIATTDFFMPIVDDPHDFGRIAAANAISDIYAMGGQPLMALAILGIPLDKLPIETVRAILAGGASVCAAAGIPVAGGHSIDTPEPIYGLAVIGTCRKENLRRNADSKPGDVIILTKPLGIGIYSAALKKGVLSNRSYVEMVETAALLNRIGPDLAADTDVHAITDVTGFGLIGHALEMARGSNLAIVIDMENLPLLREAVSLVQQHIVTGASGRNWASYGHGVEFTTNLPDWRRDLLTDPQTSGGLLISCAAERAEAILQSIVQAGYPAARNIGHTEAGPPKVRLAMGS